MTEKRILLIGTGAIAEAVYLPLLSSRPEWKRRACCVDRDGASASRAAARWGISDGGDDHKRHLADTVVAIVATPPRTHYPIASECLKAGAAAIIEKPLTDTHEEGMKLVREAKERGRLLMVNNTRRLFQSYAEVERVARSGELGAIQEIDYAEGGVFSWPTASGFYFDPKGGGRGVIADRGSHVLDLICWWVGSPIQVESCLSDAMGGVEGYADVSLSWGGGSARMRLSWHSKLANRLRVVFERGVIETGIYDFREVRISGPDGTKVRSLPGSEASYDDYSLTFARGAITAAIQGGAPPIAGADVVPSLALIDQCYAKMGRIDFPWLFKFGGVN